MITSVQSLFLIKKKKKKKKNSRALDPTGAYWTSKKALVSDMFAEDWLKVRIEDWDSRERLGREQLEKSVDGKCKTEEEEKEWREEGKKQEEGGVVAVDNRRTPRKNIFPEGRKKRASTKMFI